MEKGRRRSNATPRPLGRWLRVGPWTPPLVQAHAKHGCVPGADADPVGRGKGRPGSKKTSVVMNGGDSRSGSVLDTTGTVTTVDVGHHEGRTNRRKRGGINGSTVLVWDLLAPFSYALPYSIHHSVILALMRKN